MYAALNWVEFHQLNVVTYWVVSILMASLFCPRVRTGTTDLPDHQGRQGLG